MAKKKAAAGGKKCNAEMMLVGSKIKGYIRSKGMMTSSESLGALNCKVACLIDAAIERTKANKRSTVKPQDL